MATRVSEVVKLAGLEATYHAAAGGGDKFTPSERTFLHVKNGNAADVDVTITTPGTVVGQAVADVVVTVTAGEERFIGPFPANHFAGDDGLASISWELTASVTFAVVRI